MARPKAKAPARRYHMSGQSVVTIAGDDYYLGPHDSPESIARYAVLIGIYQSGGLTLPDDFTLSSLDDRVASLMGQATTSASLPAGSPILVKHVTALYRNHIATKYANTPTEKTRHDRLCDQLDKFASDLTANSFGPVKLAEFRETLVADGLARKYVNRLTNCVVKVFKHAVAGELLERGHTEWLRTLEPLLEGQTTAHENDDVQPANLDHVRATAEHLSPVVKSMLRVQIATGMRPKEICMMRPCDIDRSGEVWIYRPSSHKTRWRGKKKIVPIIDDARDAITEYLQRDPEAFLFSPREAMEWRRAVGRANRKTPKSCGNRPGRKYDRGGLKGEAGKRLPKTQYTTTSYHQAIKRAAVKAKVPHWHPYQCRHLTATTIRDVLGVAGLEDGGALLGHSTALMTAHYARLSVEAATRAAKVAPRL